MSTSVRNMTDDDLQLGMRLKTQAGWNQTLADWQRFLRLEPAGCFVAEWLGQPVATTTTCVFGSVGWIAMVLVDRPHRHRGIASRLVEHALSYLRQRSVATVRLDATSLGQGVYERLGFTADYEVIRFEGRPTTSSAKFFGVHCDRVSLERLADLDRLATGTQRTRLIEYLAAEHPQSVRLVSDGDVARGFAMCRPGAHAAQIGPVVALDGHVGGTLCDWACGQMSGQTIFVDIPVQNESAVDWAHARGLTEQRRFTRMHLGDAVEDQPEILWASSGAEKG